MARRLIAKGSPTPEPTRPISVPHDPVSEAVVIAACACDRALRKTHLRILRSDHFLVREHVEIWTAFAELEKQNLDYDQEAIERFSSPKAAQALQEIVQVRPDVPANLEWHVQNVIWDKIRAEAIKGPIASLVEAIRNPTSDQESVRTFARQVATAFEGGSDRKFLLDGREMVRQNMRDLDARRSGRETYPYGIPGLDLYEPENGISRRRLVAGTRPGMITVVTSSTGAGKALALDTPIPTPSGWTTMEDLEVGDCVFDENGDLCSVLGTSPIMLDRRCYRVGFSDGSSLIADGDHLWRTLTHAERASLQRRSKKGRQKAYWRARYKRGSVERRFKVSKACRAVWDKKLEHIKSIGVVRTTEQIATTLTANKGANHSIHVTKPLVLPDQILPIDPYVLGVWLGDGTTADGTIHTGDAPILDEIMEAGYRVRKTKAPFRWSIYGLSAQLRSLGVLGNKHIPVKYLRASISQRLALLQGLMDTDGYCTKNGSCNFDTMNRALRRDASELIMSLGIKAKANSRPACIDGKVVGISWRFDFISELPMFRLERKLKRQRVPIRGIHKRRYVVSVDEVTSVPVRCIRVNSPNSMYLAGKEMIPTHNTTVTANIMLGLRKLKRRILYCAWEMSGRLTLEILAGMELGWLRADLMNPDTAEDAPINTREGQIAFEEMQHEINKHIRFAENPFKKRIAEKPSNERNLDIVHQLISDSGCEVFVADLWKRCLATGKSKPDDEEDALIRQQAMVEELKVHGILLQQQRIKDIEQRPDKRPTREGIMGSSAWVAVADCILGIHRPFLWKKVTDDRLEVNVLKQRYAPWPLAIEFDWDPTRGLISGGRSMEYTRPGETSELDQAAGFGKFLGGAGRKRKS